MGEKSPTECECDGNGCEDCQPDAWFACQQHPDQRQRGNGWWQCPVCSEAPEKEKALLSLTEEQEGALIVTLNLELRTVGGPNGDALNSIFRRLCGRDHDVWARKNSKQ